MMMALLPFKPGFQIPKSWKKRYRRKNKLRRRRRRRSVYVLPTLKWLRNMRWTFSKDRFIARSAFRWTWIYNTYHGGSKYPHRAWFGGVHFFGLPRFGGGSILPLRASHGAVSSRLPVKQSLRNRLTELEELDERRRVAAQNIEAIQRRRKITFDKRNKKRALEPGMLVMIQDARKLEFPGKFDALWMGPYVVKEVFPNNSLQLETLNGESFPWRTSGSRCKQFRVWKSPLACLARDSWVQSRMVVGEYKPKMRTYMWS